MRLSAALNFYSFETFQEPIIRFNSFSPSYFVLLLMHLLELISLSLSLSLSSREMHFVLPQQQLVIHSKRQNELQNQNASSINHQLH